MFKKIQMCGMKKKKTPSKTYKDGNYEMKNAPGGNNGRLNIAEERLRNFKHNRNLK